MSGVKDPYTDTLTCVTRLVRIHDKEKSLIIAVDFDDTIYDYHRVGHEFPRVVEVLKKAQRQGHKIIVFTCCSKLVYGKIRYHYRKLGINIDHINENIPKVPYPATNKVFYNILLDDKAGLGQALTILEKTLELIDTKE